MNFKELIADKRELIQKNLKDYISEQSKNIPESFLELNAFSSIDKFVSNGKLVRGSLYLLTVEILGGKISQKHIDVACAIELMHSSLLIHDDIIDNDFIRRGNDTVFSMYIKRGKKKKTFNPSHYGISMGIVVGDIGIFSAMHLVSKYNDKKLSDILMFYARELVLVALAEGKDVELGQAPTEPSLDDIYDVYRYKTARYTFTMPYVAAAITQNADKKTIKLLDKLGETTGIVFQIKDDELGIFGDEKTIGKPVGSDIRENKKTVVRHLLFKKADLKTKKYLEKVFGAKSILFKDIEEVRKLIVNLGIKEEIGAIVDNLSGESLQIIESLKIDEIYKEKLRELVYFNKQRKY